MPFLGPTAGAPGTLPRNTLKQRTSSLACVWLRAAHLAPVSLPPPSFQAQRPTAQVFSVFTGVLCRVRLPPLLTLRCAGQVSPAPCWFCTCWLAKPVAQFQFSCGQHSLGT